MNQTREVAAISRTLLSTTLSINQDVSLVKDHQQKMYFGTKNVQKHSQIPFDKERKDVEKGDLEKSAENKKARQTQENFPGHV